MDTRQLGRALIDTLGQGWARADVDLIMSISKPANYQTKVPAVDMYVFKSSFDYANAAAVGSILLIIVAVVIVPYLVRTNRQEKR